MPSVLVGSGSGSHAVGNNSTTQLQGFTSNDRDLTAVPTIGSSFG